MATETYPTFHGVRINENCGPIGSDTLEDLEREPLFRLDRKRIDAAELAEKVRYIVSRNIQREINIQTGDSTSFINNDGEIGLPGKNAWVMSDTPLYIILKHGFTHIDGCTVVEEMSFHRT